MRSCRPFSPGLPGVMCSTSIPSDMNHTLSRLSLAKPLPANGEPLSDLIRCGSPYTANSRFMLVTTPERCVPGLASTHSRYRLKRSATVNGEHSDRQPSRNCPLKSMVQVALGVSASWDLL